MEDEEDARLIGVTYNLSQKMRSAMLFIFRVGMVH